MKQFFYTILLSTTLFVNIQAQVTVDFMTFPLAGDTLFTSTDYLPTGINITSSGGNQVWDFTSLQAPFAQQTIYKMSNDGKKNTAFPNAQVMAKDANDREVYYSLDNNIFEMEGYSGQDVSGLGVDLTMLYKPSILERRSPMNYLDIHNTNYESSTSFNANRLPASILNQLLITPDSLRIRVKSSRRDVVDAWGKLSIPGGTFDVLREKRVEYSDRRLDVQIGFFPWQDITGILDGRLPEYFGVDTIVTYHFFSPTEKEPIAIVKLNADESNIESVRFKTIAMGRGISPVITGKADVIAYPNPAIDRARFSFTNLKSGTYSLKIFNILGIVVWEKDYSVNGSKTVNVDFSKFRKGTYLYSLTTAEGKTLATKRIMIIRP